MEVVFTQLLLVFICKHFGWPNIVAMPAESSTNQSHCLVITYTAFSNCLQQFSWPNIESIPLSGLHPFNKILCQSAIYATPGFLNLLNALSLASLCGIMGKK